jgi:hypothetical protein
MIFVTCLVLTLGLLGIFWGSLPPSVPLWYERPWGQEQLAKPIFLLIIPALLSLTFVVTLFFGKLLKNHPALQKINNIMGSTLQIILTVAYIRIILLML